MNRLKLPHYRIVHRVMRTSQNTTTEVCRHQWRWVARWHAKRADAEVAPGIVHYVLPAVTA